jgi:hypothetical protein
MNKFPDGGNKAEKFTETLDLGSELIQVLAWRIIIAMKASGFEHLIFVRFRFFILVKIHIIFRIILAIIWLCGWVPVFRNHIRPLCCRNDPSWEHGRQCKKGSYTNRQCIVTTRRPRQKRWTTVFLRDSHNTYRFLSMAHSTLKIVTVCFSKRW